ncbi:RNA polymerase sigma factor FliA [Providencia sneebia]|uniref:RNA polymerase sigma factor FliA n=1 Tax=Providencia sneebia DSM 19967 TaxID=1141660 RepID=K8WR03_9GAMM|nr:RNA polymerase sigma factor FliA [Providencia sneebia]EKT58590.1 flagellar biosynthesis sigma factor [Providencia sneebia DSM 19967]
MSDFYTAEGVINKNSLWERYYPLIRHEALKLQVRLPASVDIDDLIQAGSIGLLHALERFDATQGASLATYAIQRIRGAMLDELRSRDWAPRSVRRQARDISEVIYKLEQSLSRSATETEIAQALKMDMLTYRQALLDTNNSQLYSYDELYELNGESCEPLVDENDGGNPLNLLINSKLHEQVMIAIEQLPEREKLVLILYYQEDLNLKEIGAVLDVGESRVSQLHSQAVKRLRGRLKVEHK